MKQLTITAVLTFVFLTGLSSCKEKKQTYIIKGHIYTGENKVPYRNQEFNIGVYDKDKGFLNVKDGYVWQSTIGRVETNNDGYIEFTYPHQRKGKFLKFTQDLTGLELVVSINENVEREFYFPPYGWAAFFVNTNGKLTNQDTFFVMHYDYEKNLGFDKIESYIIDTIYGNHNDHIRTSKIKVLNFRVRAGKGNAGLFGISDAPYGQNKRPDLDSHFNLSGHPHIDSIYIEY